MDLSAFDLKGRVALITGGAHGIGFSIAEGMAKCGATICFNCSSEASLEKGLAAYKAAGIDAHGYAADVSDEDAVNAMVAKIKAEVGPVDILVNNAGLMKRVPMVEMSHADFMRVIDVHVGGAFNCSKAVLPDMMEKHEGKIINICSMMSELGRETVSAYAAAKGALKMLTKNIASEYGEYNIQCNGMGPGYIATAQTAPLNLVDDNNKAVLPLVMLDSNMYGDGGWFYSGFDCIHKDQTEWCMNKLTSLKNEDENIKAMAFFHMPVREFKEAYERMKLGDNDVIYKHGSVGEKNDHFGISRFKGIFFNSAVDNGVIKWMFCGHDHLNTLSLVYKGIQLTYGMSIDYLGYKGIEKQYTQRGGTLITRKKDGSVSVKMVPLTSVVSTKVSGVK